MENCAGMSLRAYFAGQALAGYCASPYANHRNAHDAAPYLCELADALIAELSKPEAAK
jgi:hypothetical protein